MKTLTRAFRLLLVITLITGAIYPVVVTLAGTVLFAKLAGGSLIEKDGQVVGSSLIAQKFENPKYFSARPSAVDYNPQPSGGTNLGPTSKKLQDSVAAAKHKLGEGAPKELLYASGSGVDPHLSPAGIRFQVARVAQARGFDAARTQALNDLVARFSRSRDLGFLGEETVNVLESNLAVDKL